MENSMTLVNLTLHGVISTLVKQSVRNSIIYLKFCAKRWL